MSELLEIIHVRILCCVGVLALLEPFVCAYAFGFSNHCVGVCGAHTYSRVYRRIQPAWLRGRIWILLSFLSLLATLVMYYSVVLPAVWSCTDYFTTLLILGIAEG